MPIEYSPESAHAKELAKWEMRPNGPVTQSMIDTARSAGVHHGAFEYQEFPKAMYLASQTPNGIKVQSFQTAHNRTEQDNLESRGFRSSYADAVGVIETANQDAAVAAANRAFTDRRMTPQARAEADAIDASTARHLGEIPAKPIKRRGRPVKVAATVEH